MSKTNRELYEDIAEVFTNNGICSSDFAKLTELYRRTEMKGMVPLDEVIEVRGLLSRLIHDIEAPSKWGLADRVNPDWQSFNEAKEYILRKKYKSEVEVE